METMCPGQDTRYWQPGDVFEVECGQCGYEVEFFKDDAQRRCPKCGNRVSNPKLNLGCAQWCEHAKQCLGYDPKEKLQENQAGHEALTDRLLTALKQEPGQDQAAFSRAVRVLELAGRLHETEGGNPKVIFSAAVLLNLKPGRAAEILKGADLDKYSVEEAAGLISDIQSENNNNSLEYMIVSDAARLAGLGDPGTGVGRGAGYDKITSSLLTKSARKAISRELAPNPGI